MAARPCTYPQHQLDLEGYPHEREDVELEGRSPWEEGLSKWTAGTNRRWIRSYFIAYMYEILKKLKVIID